MSFLKLETLKAGIHNITFSCRFFSSFSAAICNLEEPATTLPILVSHSWQISQKITKRLMCTDCVFSCRLWFHPVRGFQTYFKQIFWLFRTNTESIKQVHISARVCFITTSKCMTVCFKLCSHFIFVVILAFSWVICTLFKINFYTEKKWVIQVWNEKENIITILFLGELYLLRVNQINNPERLKQDLHFNTDLSKWIDNFPWY